MRKISDGKSVKKENGERDAQISIESMSKCTNTHKIFIRSRSLSKNSD